MSVEVSVLDPAALTEEDVDRYHALVTSAAAVDRPENPPLTRAWTHSWLTTPDTADRTTLYWSARLGGSIAGVGKLVLPGHENGRSAEVDLRVGPEQRRRGVARALLAAMAPAAQEHDRVTLFSWIVADAPPAFLAERLGAEIVHTNHLQVLRLDGGGADRWRTPEPAGYRSVRWIGHVPDDLLELFATAKKAIQDAPLGGTATQIPVWTPERIRAAERDLAARGVERRVVVAVHEATGEIAGLTELQFHPERPRVGIQQDTSVRREHRGHGLGRFVKAEMLGWVTATRDLRPELVMTTTATQNAHMRRINEELGFELARRIQLAEIKTDALRAALG
ncbi:GNAT family N-acetyltransferase [Actinoplanes sp. N902-109]|uniref:GNAT family N-acetyltransferase n=1 Tax=Actinoplanes sp. (strain N902-109) TaxID=649831 RepID=UPI000329521C|nr:GNAT family N-acetyltransferase [Actinoplanes sp. N902-109]AGL17027.1 GCN5-related N-acetyltransferase [Actinoplanes sp. N902-109]